MKKIVYLLLLVFAAGCEHRTAAKVNEQTFIELGGEKQYVEMTGSSDKNPVLLFLHGGPGWPQTPYLRYFNADLTKNVILVSWDQAGCGKSYINNPSPKKLGIEKFISDAHELTLLLKKKFNQDKIYLAGFSWGSVIGLRLAEKYPEDYKAYFGISQVIDLEKNINLSREWIRQQATNNHDAETLKILEQLDKGDTGLCKTRIECFLKQFEQLNKYHGAIYDPKTDREIDTMMKKYADYKNYDWMGGFTFSASRLEKELFSIDLSNIKELKTPAYFFVGRHDWNVPASITEEFVHNLNAPQKEIVWFENSGHEPLEEEAPKFNKEILNRITK